MSHTNSILKKILKAIGWIFLGVLILLTGIALLIKIPAVQQKLITFASTYISDKTHTRVSIREISLNLPKSLRLEGVFLDDLQKDTLLYAGNVSVNFSLAGLLNHKIHFKNISLEDVTIRLSRKETDTLFNYNFLLTAFSDTNQVKSQSVDSTKTKWAIQIDHVDLKKIALQYYDLYGGSSVDLSLGKLDLKMDKIDTESKQFEIRDLLIDNLITTISLKPSHKKVREEADETPPLLTAKRIRINNSEITFNDSINYQNLNAYIKEFKIKELLTDLNKENISVNTVALNESSVTYYKSDTAITNDSLQPKPQKSNWQIVISKIDLEKNKIIYSTNKSDTLQGKFDAAHLNYSNLSLNALDFAYSTGETKVKVTHFAALDRNGFKISECKTDFAMNEHSIKANQLKIKTTDSEIDADILLGFSSLKSLKDSIQSMEVNTDLRKIKIISSDITYFAPVLSAQEFFKDPKNITNIKGIITGKVNNLSGKNIEITTGKGTTVKTNFIIAGLPKAKEAFYYFPDLKVNSTRPDVEMIAGKSKLPNNISLPNSMSLLINFKGYIKEFTATAGISSDYGSAHAFAIIHKDERFDGKVSIDGFDLGLLLKNKKMFGPVFVTANIKGSGLDKNRIKAKIEANVPSVYLNEYTYKKLNVDGRISGQKFEGKITVDDENAAFDFDGLVDLNKDHEQFKFTFDLKGANLQKLHFRDDDMRIGFLAVADMKGNSVANINGKAGITKIIISHNEKKYILDSFLFASINEKGKSEFNVSNAIVNLKYVGTFSPADIVSQTKNMINNYFPVVDEVKGTNNREPQRFLFEIQLHNHPILSEVFFPQLKEFEPGVIRGSFNSEKHLLGLTVNMRKIVYGSLQLKDFALLINSDASAINYKLTCADVSNAQAKLENLTVEGKAADQIVTTTIASTDERNAKKIQLTSYLTKNKDTYTFKLSDDFYVMNEKWDVSKDNFFSINKTGILIHDLILNKTNSKISVVSLHDRFNDDLDINIENLQLAELSRIVEKDTSIAKGSVAGHVLMKRLAKGYGLIANASITDLIVKNVPIGKLTILAENPTSEKFDLDIKLNGPENDISITGALKPNEINNALNIDADIKSLSLTSVQALSFGKIQEASGTATGKFFIRGSMKTPEITGSLQFNNAMVNAQALNTPLKMNHETIELKKDGVYFNKFTVMDQNNNPAVIDGKIQMTNFKDFRFGLDVNTSNFTLMNSDSKSNSIYYGKMIIDSKIKVTGNMDLPMVNARVKLKKGSNFTFAVPEKKLTTDKGEGVVDFNDSLAFDPIITRNADTSSQKSEITGLNISSIIEIDKEASLKLLLDPTSGDSLVVKGDAALSFALDPSGKMSLTGAYNLNDGSYLVALESVVKRRFRIAPGSTIIWNGDPLDANVSINAIYSVRAAPIDLVADQISGLSEADQNGFKQRYPFDVYLKLRGELLHPDISFEIQLPPEEKGIMGGAVNAKLNMLNEDPSSLNKQVFALLVLGRFVQEDPLQTETNAISNAARTTVGKFLTAQLNQLGSKLVPGVELNFDVQSYDDYESGNAEGRTEVAVGVKKQLFDERLSVQVGGSVDVEGERAKQNSASDITSDVTLEYKLTKDGRYRLKGFRHNQYEGAIDGQLVETGAGVLYVRDFNRWKDFFHKPRRKKEIENNTQNAESGNK